MFDNEPDRDVADGGRLRLHCWALGRSASSAVGRWGHPAGVPQFKGRGVRTCAIRATSFLPLHLHLAGWICRGSTTGGSPRSAGDGTIAGSRQWFPRPTASGDGTTARSG